MESPPRDVNASEEPATLASSSPSVTAESIIKKEPDNTAEEKPRSLARPPIRFSASDLLALWRYSAKPNLSGQKIKSYSSDSTAPSPPHLGTLTVGSVVFAPCRVQSGPASSNKTPRSLSHHHSFSTLSGAPPPLYTLHYALAEVTGLQVMAGTVTVSFLFTDPGVDDEAISFYECIPCPPSCLARWLREDANSHSSGEDDDNSDEGSDAEHPHHLIEEGGWVKKVKGEVRSLSNDGDAGVPLHMCCSLLERVLRLAPDDGPLPVNDIYRTLTSRRGRRGQQASRLSTAQQRCAAQLRGLYCISEADEDSDGADDAENGLQCTAGSGVTAPQARSPTALPANKEKSDATAKAEGLSNASSKASAPLFQWSTQTEATDQRADSSISAQNPSITNVLTARYRPPLTLHVFFARAFKLVNTFMEQQQQQQQQRERAESSTANPSRPPLWRHQCQQSLVPLRTPPVVLVLFDSYAALRRFHVYMAVRGHLVQLQDGTDGCNNTSTSTYSSHLTPRSVTAAGNNTPHDICQGKPPLPPRVSHAFGTACKVWLCMLRDDTAEEDANAEGFGAAEVITAQLRRLLAFAPPVDALVSFREHQATTFSNEDTTHFTEDYKPNVVTAEQVLLRLLPHLRAAHLVCHLHAVPPHTQQAAPSVVKVSGAIFGDRKLLVPCSPEQLTLLASVLADDAPPTPSLLPGAAASEDGGDVEARKPRRSNQKRPRSADESSAAARALTPALLERIALGTFTDAAAAALFDAFGDAAAVLAPAKPGFPGASTSSSASAAAQSAEPPSVPQVSASSFAQHAAPPTLLGTVEDVYEKWCVNPSRFGEAFPVFEAVYALVADVFRQSAFFRNHRRSSALHRQNDRQQSNAPAVAVSDDSALPRIALVLPRGNPTHHPSLRTQQFLNTLRLFFAPWMVHEVGPVTGAGPGVAGGGGLAAPAAPLGSYSGESLLSGASAAAGTNACVLWHQRGGLLLLFCDEATTQLGALQDEADVVVACGKTAAAWVAANAPATPTFTTTSTTTETPNLPSSEAQPPSAPSAAVYFAVISELEVVAAAEHGAHLWLPITMPANSLSSADSEGEENTCPDDASAGSAETILRWPSTRATASAEAAQLTRGQLEVLWAQLLSAIGADGNSSTVPAAAATAGKRLRHVDVLPKTLRQAVVLWRHLGESMAGHSSPNRKVTESKIVKGEEEERQPNVSWPMLRAAVKAIALSGATATPVRMSDVLLVRRNDG